MDEATEAPAKRGSRKRAKQVKFCDNFDELPEEVQTKVRQYSEALTERMSWQLYENEYRGELRDLMKQHKLKFVPDPDNDEKVFMLSTSDPTEKIQKVPRSKVVSELE
jgi:TRAP-type C4-dicarboxylate transport system substrate-binding protein